ncbi:hypothetical protein [Gordonia soli]|nr:hypothetical protein [Gordonia soli]
MTSSDLVVSGPSAWPACALGAWAAAWVSGRCSPDDVVDTLSGFAVRHEVVGPAEDDSGDGPLAVLAMVRGRRDLRIHLPVSGNPDGLPPGPATEAALLAGQILVIGGDSPTPVGVIPLITDDVCRWSVHRYAAPITTPSGGGLGQVDHDLRTAIRESAEMLGELGRGSATARRATDLRLAVQRLVLRLLVDLPPHDVTRADRILESTAQIEAIVALALDEGATFGATARTVDAGDTHLRGLVRSARSARAAAVNAVIAELTAD